MLALQGEKELSSALARREAATYGLYRLPLLSSPRSVCTAQKKGKVITVLSSLVHTFLQEVAIASSSKLQSFIHT